MRKLKIIFFLFCLALAAAGGAFVALKFYAGTSFGDAILQRKISAEVSERIAYIRATQGDVLELAVVKSTLTFRDHNSLATLPKSLGETVTEISVPAVFRFYVKLSEPIVVTTQNRAGVVTCNIIAPKLRAATPVAFDTSEMRKRSEQGWFRFNGDEQLADAEKMISLRLAISAPAKARETAVRAAARDAFEKFVRTWLQDLKKLENQNGEKLHIKIFFADDAPARFPEENSQTGTSVPVTC